MNITEMFFSTICIIVYLVPTYGQDDTITTESIYC